MPGLPPNGAAQGVQIDSLMVMIHLLMVIVFVGWGIYFTVALIRGRRAASRPPGAGLAPKKPHGKVGLYSDAAVAVVEISLLAVVALPFWSNRLNGGPSDRESTVVRVVAEQFAWNIHYPGKDGVFGRTDPSLVTSDNPLGLDRNDPAARDDIVTLNIMHLPVGHPVVIYLTSKDVIHSFFLPLYRVKQDAIPGQRVRIWFNPQRTSADLRPEMASSYKVNPSDSLRDLSGLSPLSDILDARGAVVLAAATPLTPDVVQALFHAGIRRVLAAPDSPTEIACAQLCGLGHYRMRGFLTVESDSAYQAWTAEQTALLASP